MQQQSNYLLLVLSFSVALLLISCTVGRALDCKLKNGNVASTITVSRSGKGKFTKIQEAIDSVPVNNDQWMHIMISAEDYKEKVIVPRDKPCIFLQGSGSGATKIHLDDHENMVDSATFSALAENFIAKNIVFQNTYNTASPLRNGSQMKPALAAKIMGDKSAFYDCRFIGVQDRLFDAVGRHYFHGCHVEGVVDVVFGNGQSIYENCVLNVTLKETFPQHTNAYVTAQGREKADETTGFVFRGCKVVGSGKAYLGRAYRGFSKVIFVNSELSGIVVPEGWNAWNYASGVQNINYAEANCRGAGANTSKRVPWEKKLQPQELNTYMKGNSFIDEEGWMAKLPPV